MQKTCHLLLRTMNWVFPLVMLMLLSFPMRAHAGHEMRFIQQTAYCNTALGHLLGQISLFNPSSSTITVEVAGNMSYAISGGTPMREVRTMNFTIAPGQVAYYLIYNSQTAYGCFGVMHFYGVIRTMDVTALAPVVAGNLVTSMPNSNGVTQFLNVPFSLPSQAY